MKILHLSSNYPDEITPNTTFAVKRLISSAGRFADNHCISLHSTFPDHKERVIHQQDHTVISAWGLPMLFGSRRYLKHCETLVHQANLPLEQYDMIHAHKLTLEGLIASSLANQLNKPFCVSVRATDCVMFKYKPYLRNHYLSILNRAEKIGVVAPWLAWQLRKVAGRYWSKELEQKLVLLGNLVDGDPRWNEYHNDRYVMPFAVNKSQLKRKNLYRTLDAFARLRKNGSKLQLDIIGSGSGVDEAAKAIDKRGLNDTVHLLGHVPHENMLDILSGYKALLLCSYPETFGLVYVEALISGIPIIYSRGTGVDGLFNDFDTGIAADPKSVVSIAGAIETMEQDYHYYKTEVAGLQGSAGLSIFRSDNFTYRLQTEMYGIQECCVQDGGWSHSEAVVGVS